MSLFSGGTSLQLGGPSTMVTPLRSLVKYDSQKLVSSTKDAKGTNQPVKKARRRCERPASAPEEGIFPS